MDVSSFKASPTDIATFVSSLFRYSDENSFISLRAFDQADRDKPPVLIQSIPVGSDLERVISRAVRAAETAANHDAPAVFAPPVATFNNPRTARSKDVANGVAISVELDTGDPDRARRRLEAILGPVTIAIHSGGDWIDANTGEVHPKTHLHWRLSEPTRTRDEHDRLQEARWLAAILVGGDTTAAPPAHPLRWPGSWNLKAAPRIAKIAAGNQASEVHLEDVLIKLQEAVEASGLERQARVGERTSSDPEAPLEQIASALLAIPNHDVAWNDWNRLGMAAWRASGGSSAGLEAWSAWSDKSDKHDPAGCEARWRHFFTSPPARIGAGTIFHLARIAGWQRPRSEDAPPPDIQDDGYWESVESAARMSAGEWHGLEQRESGRAKRPSSDLPLLWIDDIEPVLDARDFVQGVLIEQSAAVVYGESNSGKTFWTTTLALHVATGLTWHGLRIERGGVIYCVLEGGIGFKNRVYAWREERGLGGQKIPFVAIPASLNLLDADADVERLIKTVLEVAKSIDVPVKLIVIDTLSRALAGGNENAPDDMGALVMNMDTIRYRTGASVLFVHHSGKDQAKGARGHSSLRAAVDTEIEVTVGETGEERFATVSKQREMRKGQIFPFSLRVLDLGHNRYGEAVTTCVVEAGEGQAKKTTGHVNGLSGDTKRAFEILVDALAASGKSGFGAPEGVISIPEKWWRDDFYNRAKPGDEPDAKRKAFRRASDKLVEMHRVAMLNGRVWAPRMPQVGATQMGTYYDGE